MLKRLRSMIRTLGGRDRFREDLDDEMAFHIERHTEDLIEAGMDPEQARREARLRFGSTERVQARSREARGVDLLDEGIRNVRFAFRSAVRSPLLSATIIVVMALCVGAGTGVFSAVDAVLWRPLPYPEPDRLALVTVYTEEQGAPDPGFNAVDGRIWERVRDNVDAMERAVFSDWHTGVNLSADDAAAYVQQQRVSAGFFRTIGVLPWMGRGFDAEEDRPGGPPVVVLSHDLWQHTFGGDRGILGATIRLKGEAHTVVGVMPEEFEPEYPVDLWTPLRPSTSGEGSGSNYSVIVRVPEEMTWAEATARIRAIDPGQSTQEDAPHRYLGMIPMPEARSSGIRPTLLILLGSVLLLVLVGGADLAGLQLSRASTRRTEIATRKALGGGDGAILRQMLAESLLLGLVGGLLGLLVARWVMSGLTLLMQSYFGLYQPVVMDGRVLAAALGFTLLVTLLFGLIPSLQARGFDLRGIIAGGSRTVAGSEHRLRKVFLVGEVALVTALLFSAGLLVRSYMRLATLDPGFRPDNVLTVHLSLDDARYDTGEKMNRLFDETTARIRRIPGVEAAAVTLSLPYERALNMPFKIVGVTDPEGVYHITNLFYLTPGLFEVLDIPLLRGRALSEQDRASTAHVAVVNQAWVDVNFPDEPAIGHEITLGSNQAVQIVGVVGNVQQVNAGWGSDAPLWPTPAVYTPAAQAEGSFLKLVHTWFSPSWIVKTQGDPAAFAPAVRAAIQEVDPQMPIAGIAPLREVMAGSMERSRFEAVFLLIVAGIALLLATIGIYGIVANEAVLRTREVGVRMSLGATPGQAVRTVGLPGLRLAGIGLLLGGGLSVLSAPWVAHLVWGVGTYDGATFALVAVCMLAVATAASFIPAARVARYEPASILRAE